MFPVDCVTDIVSQDIAATLKVLYALFKKHKGKWETNKEKLDRQKYKKILSVQPACCFFCLSTGANNSVPLFEGVGDFRYFANALKRSSCKSKRSRISNDANGAKVN